jgi:serine/threonine protein kinase
MPVAAAFQIAIELARGLDFAHSHGVVHRDVSPSNILMSRAGEVKIADFGIAVAAQPQRNAGRRPRKVMGKWRYMSPEQARGEPSTPSSDLFSAASGDVRAVHPREAVPRRRGRGHHPQHRRDAAAAPVARSDRACRPRLDDMIGLALARKPDRSTGVPAVMLRR